MTVSTTRRRPSEDLEELSQQLLRELKTLATGDIPAEPELYRAYLEHALSMAWKKVSEGKFDEPRRVLDHLRDAQPFVDAFLPEPEDHRSEAALEVNFATRMLYLAEEALADAQLQVQLSDRQRSRTERAILQVLLENRDHYLRRGEVWKKLPSPDRPTQARIGQILVDFYYQDLVTRIQAPAQGNPSASFYALSEKGLAICRQLDLDKGERVQQAKTSSVEPRLETLSRLGNSSTGWSDDSCKDESSIRNLPDKILVRITWPDSYRRISH
ncbi:MAG: hypothetical protein U1F76_25470 [Candidatus Competibacteraceae bacterium]